MFESLDMATKDWVTVGAVLLGPVLAVQAQKFLEALRERRSRRLTIFKTLMSTRAERLSKEHVQSLNMIDIEFYGRRILGTRYQMPTEKNVTNAWKNYNDHLNRRSEYDSVDSWVRDGDTLCTKVLYQMSVALGYDFDEVQLKRDCYRPEAHVNIENAQLDVLTGFASVLKNERSFPMAVTYFPGMEGTSEQSVAEGEGTGAADETPVDGSR
ncbi:DUF6680 family protein [Marinobacterium aestuariivivens]|uniref:DUF6680 family protein n=1 Tax=Marinobacterium aestuariivivens TaxID=1698799 RepID=A0ABW1ZY85_9GAMM